MSIQDTHYRLVGRRAAFYVLLALGNGILSSAFPLAAGRTGYNLGHDLRLSRPSSSASQLWGYNVESSLAEKAVESSSTPRKQQFEVERQLIDFDQPLIENEDSLLERVLSTYWGPRLLLAMTACVYATNFPLGAIMNSELPSSAATSARMVVASVALSPFLFQLEETLFAPVLLCGAFVSMGYITQSLALVDTPPATVSFLGAVAVLVCPFLEWLVDGKPRDPVSSPQTWIAALFCLFGVACLECWDPSATATVQTDTFLTVGDFLALLQGIGFGTGIFLIEKMLKKQPTMTMPITAGLVSTTAFISMLWCFADGWVRQPEALHTFGLPFLFMDPSFSPIAMAVLWTGIVSTSFNYALENAAIGKVPSSESAVILATEPMWAALLASMVFHTQELALNDYVGGALLVGACLVNAIDPSNFQNIFPQPIKDAEP